MRSLALIVSSLLILQPLQASPIADPEPYSAHGAVGRAAPVPFLIERAPEPLHTYNPPKDKREALSEPAHTGTPGSEEKRDGCYKDKKGKRDGCEKEKKEKKRDGCYKDKKREMRLPPRSPLAAVLVGLLDKRSCPYGCQPCGGCDPCGTCNTACCNAGTNTNCDGLY